MNAKDNNGDVYFIWQRNIMNDEEWGFYMIFLI